jgi:fermentation-respiration switch protein FrsA (DUF1100 family)
MATSNKMGNTATEKESAPSGWKRLLWSFFRTVAIVYLGVLLVLMLFENSQVYHPVRALQDWQTPPVADIQDVSLLSADGTRLHAWWLPCPGSKSALLYLHGNAGNLSHRGSSLVKIREVLHVGVLIVDYPGFGKSEGKPSEAGCYAAGQASYDWLVQEQKIDPKQILLFGASLGGGVAVELASRQDHRALILIKTFTSLPDVGQHIFPWLPVRWVMRNRFDNLGKITQCQRPVFFGHGTSDELIPYSQGRKLFEAANQPKEFFVLEGGHNHALPQAFFQALKGFLDKHSPSPPN